MEDNSGDLTVPILADFGAKKEMKTIVREVTRRELVNLSACQFVSFWASQLVSLSAFSLRILELASLFLIPSFGVFFWASLKELASQHRSVATQQLPQDNMAKGSSLMKTLHEYSEVSTVHGISYVFSRSLPQVDRLLWTILTVTGWEKASKRKQISDNEQWQSCSLLTSPLYFLIQPPSVNLLGGDQLLQLARQSHHHHSQGNMASGELCMRFFDCPFICFVWNNQIN